MYRLVNIPPASAKSAELRVSVENETVYIKVVDKDREREYNEAIRYNREAWNNFTSGVDSMFIGDHMFEEKNRDALRQMVGEAMVRCIVQGRDLGYRQAQAEIRHALGVKDSR